MPLPLTLAIARAAHKRHRGHCLTCTFRTEREACVLQIKVPGQMGHYVRMNQDPELRKLKLKVNSNSKSKSTTVVTHCASLRITLKRHVPCSGPLIVVDTVKTEATAACVDWSLLTTCFFFFFV
jgi:hypothetical protein